MVIDISGDGQENAGFTDAKAQRPKRWRPGSTINAIAIEEPGPAFPITNYYRGWVITPRRLRGHGAADCRTMPKPCG